MRRRETLDKEGHGVGQRERLTKGEVWRYGYMVKDYLGVRGGGQGRSMR